MGTEVATVVDAVFDDILTIIRDAQQANLVYAWRLGKILDEALNGLDSNYGRGVARELVKRLRNANCEIKLSTLYGYRSIFRRYDESELPDLVAKGLTQTHAQVMATLPEDMVPQVDAKLERDDGSIISTRELKQVVNDLKKSQTRDQSIAIAELASQAREDGNDLTLVARIDAELNEDEGGDTGAGGEGGAVALASAPAAVVAASEGELIAATAPVATIAAPEVRSGDPELTKMMAKGPKAFSAPPLKTLKTADSTAIKMMAQTSQLLVALDEAARLGFDSDRSSQNFLDAAQSLAASLDSYNKVLPELITRVKSAISANTIYT